MEICKGNSFLDYVSNIGLFDPLVAPDPSDCADYSSLVCNTKVQETQVSYLISTLSNVSIHDRWSGK